MSIHNLKIDIGFEVYTILAPDNRYGKVTIIHRFIFENEVWFIVASRIKPDPILHIRTRRQLCDENGVPIDDLEPPPAL